MRGVRRILGSTGAAVAVVLLVAGCGGTSSGGADQVAKTGGPVSIRAGDCFGGQTLGNDADALAERIKTDQVTSLEDDPTWRDPRACVHPHRVEVYAVVRLPPALRKRVTSYGDLLDTKSRLYTDVRAAVDAACSRQLPGVRRTLASTRLKLDVSPAVNSDVAQLAWNAFPYDLWQKGQRQFACMLTQAKDGTATMADFFGKQGQHSPLHLCFDKDSKSVPCARPHTLESLAILTANRAVASGQLPGEQAMDHGKLALSQDQWHQLDRACTTFLDANSVSHPKLSGVASVYNNQWPVPPDDDYSFYCDATSPIGTPEAQRSVTTGSVFDRPGVRIG